MTVRLQFLLIIITVTFFIILLNIIKKSKLSTDMGSVWLLWALGLVFISLFPQVTFYISNLIGIETPINTIFLIMIFLLYCLMFYMCIKLSILLEKFKNLTHKVSLIQKELDDKNKE